MQQEEDESLGYGVCEGFCYRGIVVGFQSGFVRVRVSKCDFGAVGSNSTLCVGGVWASTYALLAFTKACIFLLSFLLLEAELYVHRFDDAIRAVADFQELHSQCSFR
ncbi:uncharacterized protein [Physcomitrium patens]|uniref:uncharacterized protein n=1 Tax=Physcomitrium patens TaxID=3218 RepID=UPI00024AF10C